MRDQQRLLVVAVLGVAALLAAPVAALPGQRFYVRGLVSGALKG